MPRLSNAEFEALYRALGKQLKQPELGDSLDRDELCRRAFESKDAHLVGRAARVVSGERIAGFDALMRTAYEHYFSNPIKRDPGCQAKLALAEALDFVDHDDAAPFLLGIKHVQKEGPHPATDTAAGLRGRCGLALVRLRQPDVLNHLADLLADPEAFVRTTAAEALSYHGDEHGAPLLRLKLHTGDTDPEVSAAMLRAYLSLDEPRALEFGARMLGSKSPALRESVAFALGESRVPKALPLLVEFVTHAAQERDARVGIVAAFTLRSEAALTWLRELERGDHELLARIVRETLGEFERD